MKFLNKLLELDFVEWNYVTKGLVEVWELTRKLGLEHQFEAMLMESENADMAIVLGRAAHDKNAIAQISERSNLRLSNGWVMSLSPNHSEWRSENLLYTLLEPLLSEKHANHLDHYDRNHHDTQDKKETELTLLVN